MSQIFPKFQISDVRSAFCSEYPHLRKGFHGKVKLNGEDFFHTVEVNNHGRWTNRVYVYNMFTLTQPLGQLSFFVFIHETKYSNQECGEHRRNFILYWFCWRKEDQKHYCSSGGYVQYTVIDFLYVNNKNNEVSKDMVIMNISHCITCLLPLLSFFINDSSIANHFNTAKLQIKDIKKKFCLQHSKMLIDMKINFYICENCLII